MKSIILSGVSVLVFLVIVEATLPPQQRNALREFYRATEGRYWTNSTNWPDYFNDNDTSDPCTDSWYGVRCDELSNATVTELNFLNNHLLGTISSSLSSLIDLNVLVLANNQIDSSIPEILCSMTKLRYLDLSNNKFGGTLPPCLVQNTSITEVYLSHNHVSGSLPDMSGDIIALDVSSNLFTGSLPLLYLDELVVLYLGNNQFIGTLPEQLGTLSRLITMEVQYNHLHGSIPDTWSNLPNLSVFDLSNNMLSGTIPPWLRTVSVIMLDSNQLTGGLEPFCTNGSGSPVEILDVQNNHLTGTVTLCIGTLVSLTILDISSNSFTGPLPEAFDKLTSLEIISAQHNYLEGCLPRSFNSLKSLMRLDMSANNLDCSLETILDIVSKFSSRSISQIHLASNALVGSFDDYSLPWWSFQLQQLTSLDLSNNWIEGSLPLALVNSPLLQLLDLSNNLFSDQIPDAYGTLPLQLLNLQQNDLGSPSNSLPSFLIASDVSRDGFPEFHSECPQISTRSDAAVQLDPDYYGYAGCICMEGYYGVPPFCHACPHSALCSLKSLLPVCAPSLFLAPSNIILNPPDSSSSWTPLSDTSFGYNYTMDDTVACFPCPANTFCNGTSLLSADYGYWLLAMQASNSSVLHPSSPASNWSSLAPNVDLFLPTISPKILLIESFICPPGFCMSPYKCAPNRNASSLLCGACNDGYYDWYGTCSLCSGTNWPVIIIGLAVLWVLVLVQHVMIQTPKRADTKILVFFVQTVVLIFEPYSIWALILQSFDLRIGSQSSGSHFAICVAPLDFFSRVGLQLALPFVAVLLLFSTLGLVFAYSTFSRHVRGNHNHAVTLTPYLRTAVSLLLFGYTSIVSVLFDILNCRDVGPFSVMVSQPSILCTTQLYHTWKVASIVILVIVTLVPLASLFAIARSRRVVEHHHAAQSASMRGVLKREHEEVEHSNDEHQLFVYRYSIQDEEPTTTTTSLLHMMPAAAQVRRAQRVLKTLGILHESYKPGFFWWEYVIFLRRSLLLLLDSYLSTSLAEERVFLLTAVCIFFSAIQCIFNPYLIVMENILELSSLSLVVLIGLSLNTDSIHNSNIVAGSIVLGICAFILHFAFDRGQILVRQCRQRRQQHNLHVNTSEQQPLFKAEYIPDYSG